MLRKRWKVYLYLTWPDLQRDPWRGQQFITTWLDLTWLAKMLKKRSKADSYSVALWHPSTDIISYHLYRTEDRTLLFCHYCHDHHLQNLTSYNRYPLQYGMGEEAAELRLDLGGLDRIMSCVAGKQVVEHHPHHYHHPHHHYPLPPPPPSQWESHHHFYLQVVVVHGQDDERDEVVVAFCVNTGRLLGTFEGSRESLLGGGGSIPLS